MIKKLIFITSMFFCTHMLLLKSETSPKELLHAKILAAKEMYWLGQEIDTLELKKDALRKQLQVKHTFTIGDIIGGALVGSVLSTPLMAVNYLNKRTVPVNYQGFLDKTTLGIVALLATRLGYIAAKKGTLATYDYFTYDEKMRLIQKDISTIDAKISQLRDMIEKMTTNYAAIFASTKLSRPEELICEKLIDLYKKNNHTFTLDELNAYFNNDKNDIAEQFLRIF